MHPDLKLAVVLLLSTALLGTTPISSADPAADTGTLVGLEDGRLAPADLEEGITILVVWASWSPRCRDITGRLDALATSWASRARIASVVFQEEPEKIRRFLEETALTRTSAAGRDPSVPVFLDTSGVFSKKYAVTTLPFLLVFRDGETVFRGKLPADPNPVIERALGTETPRG